MITMREVDARLAKIGWKSRYWGRAEVRELQHILMPDEEIVCAVNGRYENGFALLVATDRRLLLIDKKPIFLNMEDVRFDMISEVDYGAQLIDAMVSIRTINKTLSFRSIRQQSLRKLCAYVQQKVMELRQHHQDWQTQPQTEQPAPQPASVQQQPQPAQQPMQFINYPIAQSPATAPADLGAMATAQAAQQTPFYRSPYPAAFPSQPLTIRRRVSRFYPTAKL